MSLSAKLQPLFIILSALAGLALGYFSAFGNFSADLIEPFLMVLLFFVFFSVDGHKFKESFHNIKFTLTALTINFIWTPIFAFTLGLIFLNNSLDLQMGLLMLMVTPCTDWYIVFTGIAGGNIELGASILPLNLLLQIILLPVYLFVFFNNNVNFNGSSVVLSIVTVLIIPLGLSFLAKFLENKFAILKKGAIWLRSRGDDTQLVFLCLAIISMFASESKAVFQNPTLLVKMMIPLAIFFVINFLLVRMIGRKEQLSFHDITALNFTTLARNSPLSLAIAVAAFPDRPLIALALVVGSLIELPSLSIIANGIRELQKR